MIDNLEIWKKKIKNFTNEKYWNFVRVLKLNIFTKKKDIKILEIIFGNFVRERKFYKKNLIKQIIS